MRYPSAIWRPTPKHGYGSDDNCLGLGLVAHSMEGSLAAAFGRLDNPDQMASWSFSVPKAGDPVYQHIDTDNISWASGGYEANCRFWSIEHEGVAGEALTAAQLAATTALMRWLLSLKNLPAIRQNTLWEHQEMTVFGSAPTACPSGRIPWAQIIASLTTQQGDWFDMATKQDLIDAVKEVINSEGTTTRDVWHVMFDSVPNKWTAGQTMPRWQAYQQVDDLLVDKISTSDGMKARLQQLTDQAAKITVLDVNALATAIVAKLPAATVGLTAADVKAAVKAALKEGTG